MTTSGTTCTGTWAQENTAGRQYPLRALQMLGPSYKAGRLFKDMTEWLPGWRAADQDPTDQRFLAMVQMVSLGVPTYEEVLYYVPGSWSEHLSPEQGPSTIGRERMLVGIFDAGSVKRVIENLDRHASSAAFRFGPW